MPEIKTLQKIIQLKNDEIIKLYERINLLESELQKYKENFSIPEENIKDYPHEIHEKYINNSSDRSNINIDTSKNPMIGGNYLSPKKFGENSELLISFSINEDKVQAEWLANQEVLEVESTNFRLNLEKSFLTNEEDGYFAIKVNGTIKNITKNDKCHIITTIEANECKISIIFFFSFK